MLLRCWATHNAMGQDAQRSTNSGHSCIESRQLLLLLLLPHHCLSMVDILHTQLHDPCDNMATRCAGTVTETTLHISLKLDFPMYPTCFLALIQCVDPDRDSVFCAPPQLDRCTQRQTPAGSHRRDSCSAGRLQLE